MAQRVRKSFDRSRSHDLVDGSSEQDATSVSSPSLAADSPAPDAESVAARDSEDRSEDKRSTRLKRKALEKTPKKLKNPSNLQVRIRTGVIYISLTVICILASDVTTALYLAALSAICAGEFYYMLRADAKLPNELLGIVASALFPISMWLFGIIGVVVTMAAFLLVLLVWYVFWHHARIGDVAVSLFGASYTGLMMSAAMLVRMVLPEFWGGVLILGVFASVWGNDAFAYLVGSAIGKHKLAPSISPKKSWEGFIAGLVFSMGFWCLLTFIPGVEMSYVQALAFGFVCGLAGVLGDLVESRIKRNSGFKDSGTIMPGHGGLLDRCDSQFLVTLVSTLMLVLGGCIPYVF